MNIQMGTRTSEQIARYLDLSTSQAKLAAANMANIDTPGYRTVGMNFQSEMRSALNGIDNAGHVPSAHIQLVDGLISRPDGNNVSMDRESLSLAEAQLKFRAGVALLRSEFQRLNDAIHADSK